MFFIPKLSGILGNTDPTASSFSWDWPVDSLSDAIGGVLDATTTVDVAQLPNASGTGGTVLGQVQNVFGFTSDTLAIGVQDGSQSSVTLDGDQWDLQQTNGILGNLAGLIDDTLITGGLQGNSTVDADNDGGEWDFGLAESLGVSSEDVTFTVGNQTSGAAELTEDSWGFDLGNAFETGLSMVIDDPLGLVEGTTEAGISSVGNLAIGESEDLWSVDGQSGFAVVTNLTGTEESGLPDGDLTNVFTGNVGFTADESGGTFDLGLEDQLIFAGEDVTVAGESQLGASVVVDGDNWSTELNHTASGSVALADGESQVSVTSDSTVVIDDSGVNWNWLLNNEVQLPNGVETSSDSALSMDDDGVTYSLSINDFSILDVDLEWTDLDSDEGIDSLFNTDNPFDWATDISTLAQSDLQAPVTPLAASLEDDIMQQLATLAIV